MIVYINMYFEIAAYIHPEGMYGCVHGEINLNGAAHGTKYD